MLKQLMALTLFITPLADVSFRVWGQQNPVAIQTANVKARKISFDSN